MSIYIDMIKQGQDMFWIDCINNNQKELKSIS